MLYCTKVRCFPAHTLSTVVDYFSVVEQQGKCHGVEVMDKVVVFPFWQISFSLLAFIFKLNVTGF